MKSITKQKINVRISWIENSKGKIVPEVSMNIDDLFSMPASSSTKIENFKKRFFKFLDEMKKLSKTKKRKKANDYWKLSNAIIDFREKNEKEFYIINYTEAIDRISKGNGLSKSQVGLLNQFSDFFTKDEIIDEIPFTYYLEFTLKRNQLKENNLLEQEKTRFLELGKKGKLPITKEYRKQLQLLINSSSTLHCKKCNTLLEEQFCVIPTFFECPNGCLDDVNQKTLLKLGYSHFEVKKIRGECFNK